MKLNNSDNEITIDGKNFILKIDKKSGWISSYQIQGQEMLLMPLQPDFWRAPTDNDFGNRMPERCAVWKDLEKEFKVKRLNVQQAHSRKSHDYGRV